MIVDNPNHGAPPTPSGDAQLVRRLLREAETATLATRDQATGAPYASLVQVASLHDATPVLLLSGLARHTRNLDADPRASLLVDRRHLDRDALAEPRATIIGLATREMYPSARLRFLRRHPAAGGYAEFSDFAFWRMHIEAAHMIAGFGRIRVIAGSDVRPGGAAARLAAALEAEEERMIEELAAAATAGGLANGTTVAGLDIDGLDIRQDGRLLRRGWVSSPTSLDELREMALRIVTPQAPV
jgi:hypothetical protein